MCLTLAEAGKNVLADVARVGRVGLVCHFVFLSWVIYPTIKSFWIICSIARAFNIVGYFTQLLNLCWVFYPTSEFVLGILPNFAFIGAFLTLPIYKQAI